ncbi:MAG: glycosyltransferase family 2 protein [Flavobacteriales bacterium]|nr:glycosyltransferase family 2 protein [Flavobacteriales bacterium]
MNMVIPMAGEGRRFMEAGYTIPKYMIEVRGKTLLEWSVDSLPLDLCTNLIFVALETHEEKWKIERWIRNLYPHRFEIQVVFLKGVTRGQAETALHAKQHMDMENPLLVYNIDTQFRSSALKRQLLREDVDGVLGAFTSNEPRFSYAELDAAGRFVSRVAEKIVISANALTGLYHFKDPADFIHVAESHIQSNFRTGGEFYVAPVYNDLIAQGKRYVVDMAQEVNILGTPEEMKMFSRLA